VVEADIKGQQPAEQPEQGRLRDWLRSFGPPIKGLAAWPLSLVIALLVVVPTSLIGIRPQADIALEVSPGDRLLIRGLVLYRGEPVESGKLQLIVADAASTHHLASAVLDVKQGAFTNVGSSMDGLHGGYENRELAINAHFWGQAPNATGQANDVLDTERTLYSNCSTPVTRQEVLWFLAGFCFFVLAVISLFTMELTQWRARWLFAASYAATFFSVAFPLFAIVYVSQNPYLIDVMRASPFGLVRARSQPTGDAQWLLNVGGVVTRERSMARPAELAKDAAKIQADAPVEPSAAPIADARAALAPDAPPNTEPAESAVPASEDATAVLGAEHGAPAEPHLVTGGLAIPFYVIILAIFGASINMMRKVPRIHAKHMEWLPREIGPKSSMAGAPCVESRGNAAGCGIRQELIEQHMYLLAAPFLAIAVYYLLQVVAKDVAQPVIVLMGFAAGLISERIISTVIDFAQARLGSDAPASSSLESAQPGQLGRLS
jgi:hypothetical protein